MTDQRGFGPGAGVALVGAWLLSAATIAAFLTSSSWYRPLKDHPEWWLPAAGAAGFAFVVEGSVGVWLWRQGRRLPRGDRGRVRLRLAGMLATLDGLIGPLLAAAFGYATYGNFQRPFTLRGSASEMLLAFPSEVASALLTAWYVRMGWCVLLLLVTLTTWFLLRESVRARLWVVADVLVVFALLAVTEKAGSGPLTSVYAMGSVALAFVVVNAALRATESVAGLAARSAVGVALVGVIVWSFFHRPMPADDAHLVLGVCRLAAATWALARCFARITQPLLRLVENLDFRALVAARHLRAKKSGFLAFIATLSIMAVTLSTCMLCVVLSVMGGFRKDLKDKILGNHAHVVVDVAHGTFTGWRATLDATRVPGVVAATPYVQGEVMVGSTSSREGVVIRGIDVDSICSVTSLCENMSAERGRGNLRYLNHPEELLDLPAEERGTVLPIGLERTGRRLGVDDEGDEEGAESGAVGDLEQLLREDLERSARETEGELEHEGGNDIALDHEGGNNVALQREAGNDIALEDELDLDQLDALMDPAPPTSAEERAAARVVEALQELNAEREADATARPTPVGEGRDKVDDEHDFPALRSPVAAQQVLPGIVVGRELARSLRLFVGDDVDVISPFGELGPTGPLPKARRFRVAGIFYSGYYEYDMKLVYVSLEAAQTFLATEDTVTGIEIKLEEGRIDDAPQVAGAIRTAIDRSDLRVEDWQQRNRNLFGALALEKLAMFLVLGIAILIAGFCVFGTLTLMVQEKAREVGILMAMGTTPRDVVRVFLLEGLFIGIFGAAMGLGLGFVLSFGAEHFGIRMNPEVYYIDRLPVYTDPTEFGLVGIAAVAICTLATIFPAILASRTSPLEALRHE